MRPEILYPLFAHLTSLNGIAQKYSTYIERLIHGDDIVSLLWHLPRDILYRQKINQITQAGIFTIKVNIADYEKPQHRASPTRFICYTETGQRLDLVFFKISSKYISQQLPIGETRIVSGKCDYYKHNWQITHPDYIVHDDKGSSIPQYEVIYPLAANITSKSLFKYITQALTSIKHLKNMPEWLDQHMMDKYQFPSWYDAITQLHNPTKKYDLDYYNPTRLRLAYDELLAYQLALAIMRNRHDSRQGISMIENQAMKEKFFGQCGLIPTNTQKQAIKDISHDMAKNTQMLRLLQGDVGSGKTLVAFVAALQAIANGYQAAIMAPTEILAQQHFIQCQQWLQPLGYETVLLTGKIPAKQRTAILTSISTGQSHLIIGTHALFQQQVQFYNLGFITIDEQHRFGVNQRLMLSEKGNRPDILMMTATPIPRTMLLSVYGDINKSELTDKPPGRQPITTTIMHQDRTHDLLAKIHQQIADNHAQIYWVCPLIEETENSDLTAAEEKFQQLASYFGYDHIALLHGKMKTAEKQAIMQRFKDNNIKILVSTTVIEVGVDVPNASIMIIEHAQRFGLSQMHQLRGRVGRGEKKGHCILLHNGQLSETSRKRLDIMRHSDNGFYIAEEDLKLRGAGDILGAKQSGMPEFHIADLYYHDDLLQLANQEARYIIHQNAFLDNKRGQALRHLLYIFKLDQAIQNLRAG